MKQFNREERKVLFFANSGHFLTHFTVLIFPAIVTPLMKEFSLPLDRVLKISFLMYLFYGLGSLPWGLISDRISAKLSFNIFFYGVGITSILCFFSKSSTQLQFSLLSIGIFLSLYHPAGVGLISKSIRTAKRGTALGRNGIFGSAGIASAPFISGLINFFIGWRYVYLFFGIISIILAVLINFMKLEEQNIEDNTTSGISYNKKTDTVIPFILLCISMALAGFVYRGQTLILPVYFEKKVPFLYEAIKNINFFAYSGSKNLSATILASFVYFISIFGQILGGKVADRFDLRYAYTYFFIFSFPFLVGMYFAKNVSLFISAVMFILFSVGMQPVENSLIAYFVPKKWRNTSYGIKFILTFGVSSFVVYPIGFFERNYGLSSVFLLFSLIVVLLIVNNFVLIAYTGRKRRK